MNINKFFKIHFGNPLHIFFEFEFLPQDFFQSEPEKLRSISFHVVWGRGRKGSPPFDPVETIALSPATGRKRVERRRSRCWRYTCPLGPGPAPRTVEFHAVYSFQTTNPRVSRRGWVAALLVASWKPRWGRGPGQGSLLTF